VRATYRSNYRLSEAWFFVGLCLWINWCREIIYELQQCTTQRMAMKKMIIL
jgi:hypothetical protein